ncbi:hypothetical protein D3C75_674550 [compost metagenome]
MCLDVAVEGHNHLVCGLADREAAYLPVIGYQRTVNVIEQLELRRQLERKSISVYIAMTIRERPRIIQRYTGINVIHIFCYCLPIRPVHCHRHTSNNVPVILNSRSRSLHTKPDAVCILHKQHEDD